eukprot:GHRR01033249.1.p1 GENE.GHRR01033249.1~~GHRR01033249.1.p1  ORF type:complete len:202 (+),score=29.78 GHRR01033249.1:334-939(+)
MTSENEMLDAIRGLGRDEYIACRQHTCLKINDAVHGTVVVSTLGQAFLDTPAVQRLRHLKQLGAASFVHPNAEHTRFTHSLGVGHLAWGLGNHLLQAGPALEFNAMDLELLQTAGLLHDIGHGPFSHGFECSLPAITGKWRHEDMSVRLVEYLVEEYNIDLERSEVMTLQDMISNDHESKHRMFWSTEDQWKLQVGYLAKQ